ncbi:MAG: DUF359 domain-containing protein [Candidatus Aenigmarchaeota archaeon]|nr:DUF359 domain-containing protein [Candidatus Aenigmarchaeota archaeon]
MYKLPVGMRGELRRPLGRVFVDTDSLIRFLSKTKFSKLIAVGDICSKELILSGVTPDLIIIDRKTRRRKVRWDVKFNAKKIKVRNKKSTISDELVSCVRRSFKRKTLIDVSGEEDLAVLPVIKYCPSNSIVVYGLWFRGVVAVKANRGVKSRVDNLMKGMDYEN